MTWNQRRNWDKFCSEPLELVENYKQAEADDFRGWCIHHRLEIQPDGTRMSRQELKDSRLYYGRPASELVFMRFGDHITLHNTGKHLSDETRQKLSEALSDENHPFFGKTLSEEHRQKMSEALSGKNHPFFGKHHSAETRLKMSEANKGKHWWNDGVYCKYSRECPGEGWKRGRLKASSSSL